MYQTRNGKCCGKGGLSCVVFVGWGILLACLIAPFLCLAQNETTPRRPKLVVEQAAFDFGTVAQGSVVKHNFVVKNAGDADLLIQRLVPACGCTVGAPEKSILKPGERTNVAIQFDTAGFSGEKVKTVRLYTNDGETGAELLTLRGVVEPELSVEPARISFGDVARGNLANLSQEVGITVKKGAAITVGEPQVFSPYIQVKEILAKGKEQKRFKITLSPDLPTGELRERLSINITGDAKRRSINIPLFASVQGVFRADPPSLSFGIIEGTEPISRQIRLENLTKQAATIRAARAGHPAVSCKVEAIKGSLDYLLQLELDPKKIATDLLTSVIIEMDGEKDAELKISLTGVMPPSVGQ